MKKKLLIIIPLIIIILGIFIIILMNNNDGLKFKQEYEEYNGQITSTGKEYPKVSIDKDNIIKYASIDKINNILSNDSAVIYFGFPNCPWCRNAVPILLEAAEATDLEEIYYLNVADIRDEKKLNDQNEVVTTKKSSKEYQKLLKNLDSILDEYILEDEEGNKYDTNEKRLYVPLVVFVDNGEIISYHLDTVESQTDPFKPLDTKQHDELYEIYLQGIHNVLGDLCDESC